MRKATWGVLLLGVFALTVGSPIREIPALHRPLGLSLLAGYILLSLDPPSRDPLQRRMMIAGVIAALASFLLAFGTDAHLAEVAARVLAVATVTLPLWLAAGHARYVFVVAAALALFTAIPSVDVAGIYATSVHAYLAALGAFWVAAMIHNVRFRTFERQPKRIVVASNIVTLSEEQKAAALARIEKRYQNGEIPEHKYWDMRQEIESR